MRKWMMLAACVFMAGCEDDSGPINRIVVPGAIVFDKPSAAMDLGAFRRVYIDPKNPVAMFFMGDAQRMSAHFVDAQGLVDSTRLLSREERTKRGAQDQTSKASDAANAILARNALPDLGFEVIPGQAGYLLSYRYGKLSFVSYAVSTGGKLKLGAAVDMTLLAKLSKAAGIEEAFRTLPQVGAGGSEKPGRLLLFSSAPAPLGGILADNAGSLFREVADAEGGWEELDVPAPTSLSQVDAIAAIQRKVSERGTPSDTM